MSLQENLSGFVDYFKQCITGYERGESHIFLDHLFKAFGQGGLLEAGGKAEFRIKKPEDEGGGTSYADCVWKPVVLIEMKQRGENLQKHLRQAQDYWWNLYPNRPHYVVLCNFDEFWVYDFEKQPETPKDTVATLELAERWGPLAFLCADHHTPVFGNDHEAVTRGAADKLAALYKRLVKRGIDTSTAQRFTLQMLIALFAEDIQLLPQYFLTELLDECATPADSYDLLGGLFTAMNTRGGVTGGRFKGVRYFNGGLFREAAQVELTDTEIVAFREIAKENWAKVRPEIFGVLFEHSAGIERRAFGQYFTDPADIMKIVKPTIIEPWTEQITSAKTLTRLGQLRERIHQFKVLDPACGSGNFLYIAYRELKRLESSIIQRIQEFPSRAEPKQRQLSFLSAQNFYGIDINPLAIELAKVTMMIARKLAIDELHITEQELPLDNLDNNFLCHDALLDANGQPPEWPKVDVIIGNPPFVGAKLLKPSHGPDYVNALRRAYPDVPGMADYCVYWIRKAHDHLPSCSADDLLTGRAGLVGTQNIRNNQSRVGGLDYVVKTGTIIDAVENQPWSGEANVHCSIANWVKTQDAALLPKMRSLWFKVEPDPAAKTIRPRGSGPASKIYTLDCRKCDFINSALSDKVDVSTARVLSVNEGFCYTGQYPRYKGFMLDDTVAKKMIGVTAKNREVIWPFLVGREMLSDKLKARWVVDFQSRTMLEAQAFAEPFDYLKRNTLPYISEKAAREREKTKKETGQDQLWLRTWWQHFRSRPELIGRISKLSRYLVCSRVTKRPVFIFLSSRIRPGDALSCFALADDYSFGILQSNAHWLWFITKCSKFKSDFRYTPESVFDTFPWPQSPTAQQIDAVAKTGREVRRIRTEALRSIKGGLRVLYRTLELPGANPLRDAHAALDAAVLDAYGFSATKDLLTQLLTLNLDVAKRIEDKQSVTAPGIPPSYPNVTDLVTTDSVQPRT